MCLIVAKPKGMSLPKGKELKRWFRDYPHGFGVAFQYQGKVRILKGAMDTKQMFQLIDKMRLALGKEQIGNINIVMQFRQAVTGSICPAYCHPFPITAKQEELDSLDVLTECALAHNGVIFEYAFPSWGEVYGGYYPQFQQQGADVNDAQEFIKDYLVEMGESLWNPCVQALIKAYTASKFALLSNRGIAYIGDFVVDEGYYFSNLGYKEPTKTTNKAADSKTSSSMPTSEQAHISWYEDNVLYEYGGLICEFCEQRSPELYSLPNDESLVCFRCFQILERREPTWEERM